MSQLNRRNARGFSLLEVIVAILVLSVGLMAAATLMTRTFQTSIRSKDMSIATMLATEKMEDLARYPAADPHVTVPGALVGSLTADTTLAIAVGGVNTTINYFDDITIDTNNSQFTETRTGIDPGTGAPNITVTALQPDGTVTTTVSPGVFAGAPTFKRRWTIENNIPVPGMKRITVRVTMPSAATPVAYQMVMVRP